MMIELKNIKKQYNDFCLECSLEVGEGQIVGLIGRNGAGKSTAFKAMLGLISIDGGERKVLGKEVERFTQKDKEQIGVVLADSGFSGYLSVKNLLPMLKALYSEFDENWFINKCKALDLPLDKQIKEFSTGMKRKLHILAAIAHNARLLILDEPTSGLDVVARDELLELLREYMEKEGRSIVISSHISSDLEGLCDSIYMIEKGKIVFREETDVLLSEYGLIKATQEQYDKMDKEYVIKAKKESFGYSCLTNQMQFYRENYPDIVIEKGSIDSIITLMV